MKDADGYVAMRPDELSRRLKLDEVARNHIWKVEPSCATTGEGIFEGLVSFLKKYKVLHGVIWLTRFITGLARTERQDPAEIDSRQMHTHQQHTFRTYPRHYTDYCDSSLVLR